MLIKRPNSSNKAAELVRRTFLSCPLRGTAQKRIRLTSGLDPTYFSNSRTRSGTSKSISAAFSGRYSTKYHSASGAA